MKELFTWGAILIGFVSAVLWSCSALVTVRTGNKPNSDGWIDAEIRVGETNLLATVQLQAKWNTAAAAAAALAALLQVIATAIPS